MAGGLGFRAKGETFRVSCSGSSWILRRLKGELVQAFVGNVH